MNIIRILNLYKQHCLNDYSKKAKKDYSCWGYFDCMSVELVQSRGELGLLMGKDNIDMTDLWYESAGSTKELNGYYGQQSIGMFRYEKEEEQEEKVIKDKDFWDEDNKSIILIACMIQVEDAKVKESIEEIERLISDNVKHIPGIVYRTFDNCDILLFLKGNSYVDMFDFISEVGKCKEIKYKYSICGIAKEYLEKLDENGRIDEVEYYNSKLVNDKIEEIWLEVVSDEKVNLDGILTDYNYTYAKILGNMDYIIRIKDTDMRHVVCLLRGKYEEITHQNAGISNGIYNMSTVILPKWEEVEQGAEPSRDSLGKVETGKKCINEIEGLLKLKEKVEGSKNEVLYSNWLALIRFLNVLSQYENSVFSKDIFRIIFPSIKLMRSKFEDIIQIYSITRNITEEEYNNILDFEEYISEVDGMIQHLFHTSQTFLAVSGYSGSMYDIPTGLLLFYMAYAHKLIDIFNDSGQEFMCLICPLLNHKPEVLEIKTKTRDGEKSLLNICFAQRHMYMPRAFLVILSHEIFHYIGEGSRCRKDRTDHLIKMCAYAIAYDLLPESEVRRVKGEESQTGGDPTVFLKRKQGEIQEFLVVEIVRGLKAEDAGENEEKYLSVNLRPLLIRTCNAIVSEGQQELERPLRQIQPQELQGIKDVKTFLSDWNGILENVEKNRKKIGIDAIEEIVERFIYSFQEIYADISTVVCLELELKYYFEAMLISEGMVVDKDYYSVTIINRLAVVIYALCQSKELWEKQWGNLVRDDKFPFKGLVSKVDVYIEQMVSRDQEEQRNDIDDIKAQNIEEKRRKWVYFNIDGIWHEQVEYAKKCINSMQKLFADKNEKKEEIEGLRTAFDLFKIYDASNDKTFEDLFEVYDRLIMGYNDKIDRMS